MTAFPTNYPTAPREPFVSDGGYITRAWFQWLTNMNGSINGVPQIVSDTGFLHVTKGTFDHGAKKVNLGTADATGTLAAARMPALTGDVHSAAGSVNTVLPNVNGTPGSFTLARITVNAKGQVTAASNGTITAGGNPHDVQFNNAGALGGTDNFQYDGGSTITLKADLSFTAAAGNKIGTTNAQKIGFWGAVPVAQQTVTGSRAGNVALADLLTKLATAGIIVDGTVP